MADRVTTLPQHRISVTDNMRSGAAVAPDSTVNGVPLNNVVYEDLGTPELADADALVKAATSTELPNAATKTYTFPGSASPIDGVNSDGVLDVPRNVTIAVTHATSIVAMSVTFDGYDQYGRRITETLAVTATGTSKTADGKKAFKSLSSVAITSASDATANTLNAGFGDALGLSYRVAPGGFLQGVFDGTKEGTQGTFVNADASTPSATTGDPRGTYDPNGTLDGAKKVEVYYVAFNGPSVEDAFGKAQSF